MKSHNVAGADLRMNRRQFVSGTAAAFLVPVTLSLSAGPASAAASQVGAYIRIDDSNIVTLLTGQTEMGQGIGTGLAQLIAEELMLDWAQVRFEHAPVRPADYGLPGWGVQVTGGSTSMMMWYTPLRIAAAKAAYRLRAAAALTHGGSVDQWSLVIGGKVKHATYGEKLFSSVLGRVADTADPGNATPAGTKRIVGQSVRRLDIAGKVDGSAVFGMDVKRPGMVFASVIHCPTITGTVKTCPTTASGALKVVNLGNAVGVVASNTYAAMKIANALQSKITWNLPANLNLLDSTSIAQAAIGMQSAASPANLQVFETAGTAGEGIGVVDATYTTPFLAHACMEVLNATVQVTKSGTTVTGVELWIPTQGQSFVRNTVRSVPGLSGLTDAQITVNSMLCGGGFGRKIEQDYVLQAVKLAVAAGAPVKLTWSRPQDFKNDRYRPYAVMRARLGGDVNGITGLVYRNVSASINFQQGANPEDTGAVAGAVNLPYAIPNKKIEFAPLPTAVPLGYWRSVGESYNTFAIESAIDELVVALGQDPITYRKRMLTSDARATQLLQTLQNSPNYVAMNGSRRGVAFLKGFNSYIALAVEVGLDAASQIRVTKAHYVVDCGVLINPNAVEAQMQGGLVHGIYSALYNQVTFTNGVPNVQNFSNYRVLTAREMPRVTVDILEGDPDTASPGGIGETGVPCVAPAIANAYFRMSGVRVRQLPFHPGTTMTDD
jgi:isoquinoline 1-oxidoreductase subunit beta